MHSVNDFAAELERLAPLELAESWDNVGLLVGDRSRPADRVMTCLTLTPTTVAEAIDRRANLVVVHHPLPFKPIAQLTTDTTVGRLLWELIGASISVYSAHTAFDSAREGINAQWASSLGLSAVKPLISTATATTEAANVGAGRFGLLASPLTLEALANRVKQLLSLSQVRLVGARDRSVGRIAIACGSGGSLLAGAGAEGCDCLVTGEATFHTCLEAEAAEISMILTGHYASERFAMERLAEHLAKTFPGAHLWASETERDPLSVV